MTKDDQQQGTANHLNGESFLINEWKVFPDTLRIQKGENIIKLEPKVMQVLVFLATRPGEVVSRQELEDHVWEGTIVGYDAVTNTIIKLRKAFGDSPRKHRVIETIPKTGYRLTAEVVREKTVGEESAVLQSNQDTPRDKKNKSTSLRLLFTLLSIALLLAAFWLWSLQKNNPLPLPDEPSIAVMPFVNIGNDPEQNYFSDGITEDLITDLSNVSSLFVIARNSSFQYKNKPVDVKSAAKELGVRFILQGSVRRNKNEFRINIQLMDSTTDENVWAERYDANTDDLFKIQDNITRKIISALSIQLTENDQELLSKSDTLNLASYDEFLKGWERYWKFSRDDFAIAETHFKKALQIDPQNSRAHAALALIYWQAWLQKWHENYGTPHAGWTRAWKELDKAMLNPTPLTHSTKSAMLLINHRYEESIAEAEKAIKLNKNNASGYLALADSLSYSGLAESAIENAKKGMRLDPNFVAPYLFVVGRSQFDMGNYNEAIKSLKRALAVNPRDRDASIVLIACYGQQGLIDEAKSVLNTLNKEHKIQKLRPVTIDWLKNRWPYKAKAARDHLIKGMEKAGVPQW